MSEQPEEHKKPKVEPKIDYRACGSMGYLKKPTPKESLEILEDLKKEKRRLEIFSDLEKERQYLVLTYEKKDKPDKK
jgi:hypothetical protein